MRLYKKIILIIAILLVVVGAAITAVAMNSVDFNNSNGFDLLAPEAVTYSAEGDFSDISISDISSDVFFAASDDDSCKIVCYETKKITHDVEIKDGRLTVSARETGKWYNFISFGWYETKITVYLPEKAYERLSVTSVSGNIDVPGGFEFSDVNLKSTSGDICFLGEAKGELKLSSTSGSLRAENLTAKKIEAVSTSGDITVSDVSCTELKVECTSGDIELVRAVAENHLSAECVSGDIKLHNSDAQTLYLKTTSGDVEGILLTSKVFIADSTSGDVSVPQTTNTTKGGICEIKTTSGDIEISVKTN